MIRGLLERIPALRASEAIADVTRIQIGTGHMDPGDAQRISRGWERDANGNPPPDLQPKQKGFVSAGMRVIQVPKKPSP